MAFDHRRLAKIRLGVAGGTRCRTLHDSEPEMPWDEDFGVDDRVVMACTQSVFVKQVVRRFHVASLISGALV